MRIGNARDLGAYLRDQRIAAGLSQAALADRAGVSRRWLTGLEGGKPSAEVGLVLRVTAALGQLVDVHPDPPTDLDLDVYLDRYGDGA